jgi:hypothetical protein
MRLATSLCLLLSAFLLSPAGASAAPPPIKHVFVIVLENKDYEDTFGPSSKAPYLSKTLAGEGQLLTRYHGVAHESLPNYIAMVSGQSPNPQTQSDCQFFTEFLPGTIGADGQAMGSGCVYPAAVKTVADQFEAKGLTWKGYMEGMGSPCRHPAIGAADDTQTASAQNQYAARHNPFVYFHSIIDRPACQERVRDLTELTNDLKAEATTPNYAFITPDLCHDGHDTPCKGINEPGGLESADAFLKTWVPRITRSPAYSSSLLAITFDESESGAEDCCNEPSGPNTPNNGGPEPGNGGGRTGTVLLSPYVQPGVANDTPYNHYSFLRSVEDIFGLGHLGYAGRSDLRPFGDDVYNRTGVVGPGVVGPPTIRVRGVPRKRCVRKGRRFKAKVRVSAVRVRRINVMVDRRSLRRTKTKRFTVRVGTRRLHGRHHRLTVRVSHAGASGRKTVRFRTC